MNYLSTLTAADDAGDHVLLGLAVDGHQVRPHSLTLGAGHAPAVLVQDHQVTMVVVVLPARQTDRVSCTYNIIQTELVSSTTLYRVSEANII